MKQRSEAVHDYGVSLLECMFVMLGSSLLMAIALPKISEWRSPALKAHCAQLANHLRLARVSALIHKRTSSLIHESEHVLSLHSPSFNHSYSSQLFSYQLRVGTLGDNMPRIEFSPELHATPASLLISTSDSICEIRVSLRGRVEVQS